ncbi:hypothetical protein C8Q73DRAFT_716435 [Cubamyces lactineus]|nr:hypothetical protein C8Q73DRAFT_716435 [Cubamyces lactineus]
MAGWAQSACSWWGHLFWVFVHCSSSSSYVYILAILSSRYRRRRTAAYLSTAQIQYITRLSHTCMHPHPSSCFVVPIVQVQHSSL